MVKGVVKPVSVGYGCYQEIENPTPQKFFSAVIIPYLKAIVKYFPSTRKNCVAEVKEKARQKIGFIFEKALDFLFLLWYVVMLTEKEAQPMKNMIKELWHGNIIPQEDSKNNSKEMKELLGYMARHHEDLEKTFTDEQKEIFEKFHDYWDEYVSLAEAAILVYAFKLGMKIAIETLTE